MCVHWPVLFEIKNCTSYLKTDRRLLLIFIISNNVIFASLCWPVCLYVPLLLIYQSHIHVFSIPFTNTHVYHTVVRIFGGIVHDIILEFLELFIGGGCTRITQWLSLCFSTGERCTHLSISVSYLGKQMFVVSFVYFHWQNIAYQWLELCFQQYHLPWWATSLILILCTYQGCYHFVTSLL